MGNVQKTVRGIHFVGKAELFQKYLRFLRFYGKGLTLKEYTDTHTVYSPLK